MKKKLLFITLLSLISSMAFATDFASEFDPYSTQQPSIETGYKKSKNNIDRTIIEEMEKDSVNIEHLIKLAIELRNAAQEDFEIPETSNFNILVFIYSVIDNYFKSR